MHAKHIAVKNGKNLKCLHFILFLNGNVSFVHWVIAWVLAVGRKEMENYFLESLETHIFVALIGSYGQCYLPEGGNKFF